MSIGTVIPQKRTAGGCGPRKPSKKMKRRRAQAKAKARVKARGKMNPAPKKRRTHKMPDYDYSGAANRAPRVRRRTVFASANQVEEPEKPPVKEARKVIRRRTVFL